MRCAIKQKRGSIGRLQFHWTDDWSRSLERAEHHPGVALQEGPQVAFVHYIAAVF